MEDNNQIFDPETCPLDLLRKKIAEYTDEEDYYNTMQQSAKTFINSVYGVFGTEFFNLANTDIAESITLQGQDLIKYSVIQINDYIKNMWNQDVDGHKRVADRMKALFGDAFEYDKFMNAARTNKIMIDTLQVYGDSILGNSVIELYDGSSMAIEDMFNEVCDSESFDKIRVKSERIVKSYDIDNMCVAFYKIKYIMRHKTKKSIWRLISEDGKKVDVTEDHSLIVFRNSSIINVKPKDVINTDKLVVCDGLDWKISSIESLNIVDFDFDGFVYDIEIDTDDSNHNFFANHILVHNTDSVSFDSVIRTDKHPNGITIEDLYNLSEKTCKHTSKKWKIVTEDEEMLVDDDSYILVNRSGVEMKVLPCEIVEGDDIIGFDFKNMAKLP